MRKNKQSASAKLRAGKIKQHTPSERMHLRRKKRKKGPAALKRKAARAAQREWDARPVFPEVQQSIVDAGMARIDAAVAMSESALAVNQPTMTGPAVPYAPFVHEVE